MKIYTYYQNINHGPQNELIDLWKISWSNHGYEPIVLNLQDAKRKHEPNHPPSNYFLKLLELICQHFDWQYFSKEDHDMFLKTGFPYEVNLK